MQRWVLECHTDGLVQERRNSIASALELCVSWTNPSTQYFNEPKWNGCWQFRFNCCRIFANTSCLNHQGKFMINHFKIMLKSTLVYGNFLTGILIGCRLSCQPIISYVWKFVLTRPPDLCRSKQELLCKVSLKKKMTLCSIKLVLIDEFDVASVTFSDVVIKNTWDRVHDL